MKNIFNYKKAFALMLPLMVVLAMASCKKDSVEGGKGAPTIERVRTVSKVDSAIIDHRINLDSTSTYLTPVTVPFDSTTTTGKLSNQYAIIGANLATAKQILINGTDVYFNPALVTDKTIIFSIPATTPWAGTQPNQITVITNYGKIDYTFNIQQPAATLTSFAPLAAGTGDVVTLKGVNFDGVTAVTFDKVPADIISASPTEIKVKVPAGIVQAFLYVTTPGGTVKSTASFGFKSLVYDDRVQNGWGNYDGYGSVRNFSNTEHPKRGVNAISTTVNNGYGALQIGYGGATLDAKKAGLTAIKFSVYGGAGIKDGDKIRVVINGGYGDASSVVVTMKAGAYTDYTIPLSALGDPGSITELVFQTQGVAAPSTFYIDDIGFI